MMKKQLSTDMFCKKNAVSLLAKWMPSENASSKETIRTAKRIRNAFGVSAKEYRQMLSKLRTKINVREKLMSANRWNEIEFDKIPSKAGLVYKNAFARRDIIAKKYERFAKDKTTKVNASTLYPYEVVAKATEHMGWGWGSHVNINEVDRAMINKYWENLPDYLNGKDCSMMCVVDTSGSMVRRDAAAPINVAISLGLYCAERISGPFKNHYISFSSRPQLIRTEGVDFVDKVNMLEYDYEGQNMLAIIGKCRSLFGEKTGSVLWADIYEHAMPKAPKAYGLNQVFQVFGHTRLEEDMILFDNLALIDSQQCFMIDDRIENRIVPLRDYETIQKDL
jgi:hypothetical protein